jgi:hypothetical protein
MKERNSERLLVYLYIALVAMYVLGVDVQGLIDHVTGATQQAEDTMGKLIEAKQRGGPLMTAAVAVAVYNIGRIVKKFK